MTDRKKPDPDAGLCLYEASRGTDTTGRRDCSDDLLPEGDQIDDAERALIRAGRTIEIEWPGRSGNRDRD